MQGEALASVAVDDGGIVGDRSHGILDLATGRILSAKWEPRLLAAAAEFDDDGTVVLTLPSGEVATGLGDATDRALSGWLGRDVSLRAAGPGETAVFQAHVDPLDDASDAAEWTGPDGSYRDEAPVHLLTTATLRAMAAVAPEQQWNPRRFRANVVIDADGDSFVEDEWVGTRVRLGEVELEVFKRTSRCSMVAREQPGGLVRDADVVRSLRAVHDLKLGVHAAVATGGRLDVGCGVERVGG
jgi:hypothetical protein